jgi:hypothetical protein
MCPSYGLHNQKMDNDRELVSGRSREGRREARKEHRNK